MNKIRSIIEHSINMGQFQSIAYVYLESKRRRKNGAEKILEIIILEKFPKFMTYTEAQT